MIVVYPCNLGRARNVGRLLEDYVEQEQEEELRREIIIIERCLLKMRDRMTFYYHLEFPLDDNGMD